MTIDQSPKSGQQISEETFYHELANRFFHPNSYFLHCLNSELETLPTDTGSSDNNNNYLLLGNLVDRLVSADDTTTVLSKLAENPGFAEFDDKLRQGIKYLYESDIDSDTMKIEVASMAHTLFNSVLLAVQDTNTIDQLRLMLGVNTKSELPAPTSTIDHPPSRQGGKTEPVQEKKEKLRLQGEERNIHTKTDSSNDTSLKSGVADKQNVKDRFSITHPPANGINGLSREPAGMVKFFQRDVGKQLTQLAKMCANLERFPESEEHRQASEKFLGSMALNFMIYGFEAYEQVAAKAQKAIRQISAGTKTQTVGAALIIQKTIKILRQFLAENPEKIDSAIVNEFTTWLQNPMVPVPNPPELTNSVDEYEENQAIDEQLDDSTDHVIRVDDVLAAEVAEVNNFKLPGEDDDEILELLAEINNNNLTVHSAPLPRESGLPSSHEPIAGVADEHSYASTNSDVQVCIVEDSPLTLFKQQAELYFCVIEEALETLHAQRQNKIALEDLELGANALYGLALKLNLDSVGVFPDLILTIVKNTLATKYAFSDVEHKLLTDTFVYFRNADNLEEFAGKRFHGVLASLSDLSARVKSWGRVKPD